MTYMYSSKSMIPLYSLLIGINNPVINNMTIHQGMTTIIYIDVIPSMVAV